MRKARQTIINGSAHNIPLPDKSIHTCITSPPYFGLRDYAGDQEVEWPAVFYAPMPGMEGMTIPAMAIPLGMELTPAAYIGHLVLCFREVRRVLRDDGVAWVVMGDSYAHSTSSGRKQGGLKQQTNVGAHMGRHGGEPGDLMFIPHRLALALQADGWTVRNDNPWAKSSVMPEPVAGWRWEQHRIKVESLATHKQAYSKAGHRYRDHSGDLRLAHNKSTEWIDCPGCPKCSPNDGLILKRGSWRHTRSHENVFMLTKGMQYYADQESVRQPLSEGSRKRLEQRTFDDQKGGPKDAGAGAYRSSRQTIENLKNDPKGANPRSVISADALEELWCLFVAHVGSDGNLHSVLTPKHQTYSRPHFAVYPPTLITPLMQATCPSRCCPECGEPWAAVVERERRATRPGNPIKFDTSRNDDGRKDRITTSSSLLGYRPTCSHDTDPIPGTCLDPFVGSGTTLHVARELDLNAIGLDISPAYLDEHVKLRLGLTPANALTDLPLFAKGGLDE